MSHRSPQHVAALERKVLRFITDYIDDHGYPPTMGAIAKGLGFPSRSTAHRYVQRLRAKGHLVVEPGNPRAMRVVS